MQRTCINNSLIPTGIDRSNVQHDSPTLPNLLSLCALKRNTWTKHTEIFSSSQRTCKRQFSNRSSNSVNLTTMSCCMPRNVQKATQLGHSVSLNSMCAATNGPSSSKMRSKPFRKASTQIQRFFRPLLRIFRGFPRESSTQPIQRVLSIMITARCEDHPVQQPGQRSVLMFLENCFGHDDIMQAPCLLLHRRSVASIPRVMRNGKPRVKVLTRRAENWRCAQNKFQLDFSAVKGTGPARKNVHEDSLHKELSEAAP